MRRLGYVLLAIGMTGLAQAQTQTPPPVRDPGERLHREQLEKARERVLERGEAEIEIPDAGADTFGDTPELLPEPGPVFQIRAISRQDEVLLDERIFRQIVAPFEGKPLGVNRINLLLDRLNRALVAAGYITSRAYVASRNLSDGELVIAIVPGRIESIRYNGRDVSSGEAGFGVRLALPIRGGDILRLPDIEQAVDQLNRLRRNNVQIQIKPGARPGGSLVELINVQSDSARYQLTGDNQGAPGTGRFRLRTDVETGDMLGLMESLSVGLTSSMETNAVYGAFSLPLGYHTLSFMSSWSEYQNLIGHTALVHGTSNSYALTLHRIVHRDQRTKTAMDLTVSRRQSERQVNNVRLTPQTQTTARIGLNRLMRARIGTAIGHGPLMPASHAG
jgi:hemolysin activation/secretion protein